MSYGNLFVDWAYMFTYNVAYRVTPLLLVLVFLVIIPGMINVWCSASFGTSLIIPPVVVGMCRSFVNWVLSLALIFWINFWALIRNLINVLDMFLSLFDYNVGKHLDASPRITNFMKGSGLLKMLYPKLDYEEHEKRERRRQESSK